MATLNTLRTRFGIVLSAVIAVALLAFIFSLSADMGFTGNDPVVAQINGKSITYTEYQKVYDDLLTQSGITDLNEQQAEQLYNTTWQALISQVTLEPGFEEMGLKVSDAERMAIIRGDIPTQAFYSAFADPMTGAYSIDAVNSFLFTSQGNPQAEAIWTTLIDQALIERATMKYISLVGGGVNVNSLEVAEGVATADKKFSGRWASRSYTNVADSLVSVTSAEIKSYYDERKESYKRQPTRTISYVEFPVEPSDADRTEIEKSARSLASGLAQTKDIRKFLRESRSGSVASNYLSAEALSEAERKALTSGRMYGPEVVGSEWRASRVESTITASDTLSVRHIVLSYTQESLADSLLVALRKGTDAMFEEAAATYSLFEESGVNGGDIGAMPFSALTDEFATGLASARKGDIVKVATGDMIQLIQVYDAGKRVTHYRVATLDIPIVASQATRSAAHSAAGLFAVAAKGDTFANAVGAESLSSHKAELTSATRNIAAIAGSSEVARWAHRAKVGDLSEIFKVDNGYVVAMLTETNDNEYRTMDEVRSTIERTLMRQKKFEVLESQISGSTFEQMSESIKAKSGEFTDINFGSFYINGLGVEPRAIGAITTSEKEGVVSAPIEGNSSLIFYIIDSISESSKPSSDEAERVRATATMQQYIRQALFTALESLSDIKDLRGKTL